MIGGHPLRALVFALLVLAAVLPAVSSADNRTPGFQVQADGLMFGPLGNVASQHDVAMSSLFGNGGGYAITATIGLNRRWAFGMRAASYRSSKDTPYAFDEMTVPAGQTLASGSGPYTAQRELRLLPIHAILQYRRALWSHEEILFDGGLGVLSTTDHMSLFSSRGNGTLSSIAAHQKDPSWTLGLGLAWQVPANLDLVASARYCGTLSGDGAVWLKNDDPSFHNFALGLRYPHDTH
jgi:opacity protein-like surface antigen